MKASTTSWVSSPTWEYQMICFISSSVFRHSSSSTVSLSSASASATDKEDNCSVISLALTSPPSAACFLPSRHFSISPYRSSLPAYKWYRSHFWGFHFADPLIQISEKMGQCHHKIYNPTVFPLFFTLHLLRYPINCFFHKKPSCT